MASFAEVEAGAEDENALYADDIEGQEVFDLNDDAGADTMDEDEDVGAEEEVEQLQAEEAMDTAPGLRIAQHSESVYSVAMSSDGRMVLSGGGDDRALLCSAVDGRLLCELGGHSDSVVSVGFNASGALAATGSYDGTVRIWEPASGRLVHALDGPSQEVEWLRWHPKGDVVVAGSSDGTAWLWHAADAAGAGTCMQVFAGHLDSVTCGCFTGNGKRVLTGSLDGSVRLWNPKTGECVHSFSGHDFHNFGGVVSLAVHPTQPMAASGGQDGTARVIRLESKRVVGTLAHDPSVAHGSGANPDGDSPCSVEAVDFCDTYPFLATGGTDGAVKVWDLNTAQPRQGLVHAPDQAVVRLRWLPQSPLLATCCTDGALRVFDARSGAVEHTVFGHADMVLDFCFAAIGKPNESVVQGVNGAATSAWRFASASDDKTVRVVDLGANFA